MDIIKMSCPPGKSFVMPYEVKSQCRKAKGGILGQALRAEIAKRKTEGKLARQLKKQMKAAEMPSKKRKARTRGGKKKKSKMA